MGTGIGTMTGVLGQLCCGQIHGKNVRLDMPDSGDKNYTLREKLSIGMAAAVLQLVLAPLVFGWIWSIRYLITVSTLDRRRIPSSI